MFGSTYAVSWRSNGSHCAGRLDVGERAVLLTGAANGCRVREAIAFREIARVQVERGRMHLVRRDGRSLSISSLDAPGALRELAERLALKAEGGRR
jgi:hypothetical protein